MLAFVSGNSSSQDPDTMSMEALCDDYLGYDIPPCATTLFLHFQNRQISTNCLELLARATMNASKVQIFSSGFAAHVHLQSYGARID